MTRQDLTPALAKRRAGILLHPTALPERLGPLGTGARRFIDFLAGADVTVWQMLPVGPTHHDRSPYNALSANAGSADLIDLGELADEGWLNKDELAGDISPDRRRELLSLAAERYLDGYADDASDGPREYVEFLQHNAGWLHDYALFQALRERYQGAPWTAWPGPLRDSDPSALEQFQGEAKTVLRRVRFEQFVFYRQWQALRRYGHERGVYLFGDIPIFVAHDSVDVWAHRHLFKLNDVGEPLVVAGVPPDYFSERGQHWGNPLYDWDAMAKDGYQWWLDRLGVQQKLFDLIRIDHFRGLMACWEIPADSGDPRLGEWVSVPGHEFLEACFKAFPKLPIVAENLGVIGADVEALRQRFSIPGMAVLQFGFDGQSDNPDLNHNHHVNDVIYTGTHDNDTSLGWYLSESDAIRRNLHDYIGSDTEPMPWCLIRLAMQSVSRLAIIPLQDVMGLDSRGRVNTPGTSEGNWRWQFEWDQIDSKSVARFRHLVKLFGRAPPSH